MKNTAESGMLTLTSLGFVTITIGKAALTVQRASGGVWGGLDGLMVLHSSSL